MAIAGGVSRWTRYFVMASAVSMVLLQIAILADVTLRAMAVIGLFGAVLPMVFGMAYLLIPSYVGRTLSTQHLPGIHFFLAYIGAGLLAGSAVFELGEAIVTVGTILWSAGIVIFVGTLLYTVVPAVVTDPEIVLRSEGRPQRSTRLSTIMIPVAIGYLLLGTLSLLGMRFPVPDVVNTMLPVVVHYYAAGFTTLLIFALGIRLLTGFFHVAPPTFLSWLVLLCGAVAPGILARNFWEPPWFLVGAGLELLAMIGYAVLIGIVGYRTDRRRIGLYGISLGAIGGCIAVGVATVGVFGLGGVPAIAVHVPVVLDGFLLLTIIGYAYQFFPVTNEQFRGATERGALTTILCLGCGVGLQAINIVATIQWLGTFGVTLALIGTLGYVYLIVRRLSH